jgi:succinyl-CoA synthetase beta subunit
MNLHEYQAKEILSEFGVPSPEGIVISTVEEALAAARKFNRKDLMVKVMVYAGGRGTAGGVRYVRSEEQLSEVVGGLLGKRLVTYQTDAIGQLVNEILITIPCDIEQELYLSMLIDRKTRYLTLIASTEGGVEIEEVSKETPEKIFTTAILAFKSLIPNQGLADIAYQVGKKLNLPLELIQSEFTTIVEGMYRAFTHYDLSLIEINPLIIDKKGHLLCLDAKITMDDNAAFRQSKLIEWRDPTQEDARENHAHAWNLNYIALEGTVGCMVNGAGLAMATMDLIKSHGGEPANFLDIGGSATKERVVEAFKLILSDESVEGVFVNIFGGIVRCDMVAEGIIGAVSEVGIKIPVMVRLVGNNADKGIELLRNSGLNLMASDDLATAAKQIIEATE